jgi:diguanylate cyclase
MDSAEPEIKGNRILVVDDNAAIHDDFRKVLCGKNEERARRVRALERSVLDGDGDLPPESLKTLEASLYEVDSAFQGEEALERVRGSEREGRPYALIFMDVRMPPGWDGIETIRRIWAEFPDIEMVVCTAYSDYSWEEILEKVGNGERLLFLRKPFDTVSVKQMALALTRKWQLTRRLQGYVRQLEAEVSERTKSEERLRFEASHDPLTGLANRASLDRHLRTALEGHGDQSAGRFGLFYLDAARFKEINDTLGYRNGDRILGEIASRLERSLGSVAFVARVFGNEFALMVPSIDSEEAARKVARQICQALEAPFAVESLQLEVRVSISIVLYPDHGVTADELMRRADMTMWEAKRACGEVLFYEPKFDQFSPERLTLLGELRRAIASGDLQVYYQPKVDLKSGWVEGFEALVRWDHPIRGFMYPGDFVPAAERGGLSEPLSLWMLQKGIEQWKQWNGKGWDFSVSINLSAKELLVSDLPVLIGEMLRKHGMPAHRLVLEITERAMMEDPARARETMLAVSRLGVRLSIDDFGVGYSSLVYLRNSPVNEIKIDRSFVSQMADSNDDMTIVRSTISLGQTLGLKVVAEGVENERDFELLKQLSCDSVQGHYICEARPAAEIESWLTSTPWLEPSQGAVSAAKS